jgi:hypothetical protein
MNYFEEEEQYMSEMTNAQMEDEYNRLAAMQAEDSESQEERINSCKNEQNDIQARNQIF